LRNSKLKKHQNRDHNFMPHRNIFRIVLIAACFCLVSPAAGTAQTTAQKQQAENAMARGVAMAQRKQWPLAIKYFKAAFQATPTDPRVLFNLGLAHDRAGGRTLAAAAWYRAFLIAAPRTDNSAKVQKRVVDLEIETESQIARMLETAQTIASQVSGKGKTTVLDRIARAHAENGDIVSAQQVAQGITSGGRQSAWSQALIAALQARGGLFDQATSLAKSIRSRPAQAWALAEIAVLNAGKGDFAAALAAIDNVRGRESAWAYSRIASLQAQAGDSEGARTTLKKIGEAQLGLRLVVLAHLAAALGSSGQPWHIDQAKTHLDEIMTEANKVKNFKAKLAVYLQVIKARLSFQDVAGAEAVQRLVTSEPYKTAGLRAIAEGNKQFKTAELYRWSGLALQMANSAQLGNISQLLAQAKLQDPAKGALSIAKIAEKSAHMLRQFRQP
jgi:hypothetical protein